MSDLINHLTVFSGAFDVLVYTSAAFAVALAVGCAIIAPFYEFARYERRWWDE
jgi:hypothetical protein